MLSPKSLPSGLTELLEELPSKKLLDAIIQEGCDASCLSDAINIVNLVDFCLLVENAKQFMLEEWEKFESCLQKEIILYDGKEFIHLTDFSTDPVTMRKITRRFRKLKDSYLHYYSSNVCKKHQKDDCNLVPKHIAFLFYLSLLLDNQQEDPQNIFEPKPKPHSPFPLQSVSTIENLDKAEELEEEPIDFALEEKKSANLNVAKDFVDIEGESKEEFLALDLETSNQKFLEAPNAFEFCLKRVADEEPVLKDEDFEARLVELGIDNLEGILKSQTKLILTWKKKNLEQEGQIEANELQKIELLNGDNVLGRAEGSRATSKYTGHALIYYLPKLDKDVFCAFHSQFLDNRELSMFAIKTLLSLFEKMSEYVNSQRRKSISAIIHHMMVASRIHFQQGGKKGSKPMEAREQHEPKGKNNIAQSSSKALCNNKAKAKEKGYKDKAKLLFEEIQHYCKDNKCFKCGEQGHVSCVCPKRSECNEPPRVNTVETFQEDGHSKDEGHCKGSPLSYAWGNVREHDALMLFDLDSIHNLTSKELATRLGIHDIDMGDATKADGSTFKGQEVSITSLIGKLRLHVQSYVEKEDSFISPLKHEDVILEAPWFDCMDAIIKFPKRKVLFSYRGKELTLDVTSAASTIAIVQTQAFGKIIKSSISCYMVFVKESKEDACVLKSHVEKLKRSLKFLNS
ncbi:hypothetical protein L7F22_006790 [Adiantum nelumboides]|nr:hypothetical protein [Adiantum nelumboides]